MRTMIGSIVSGDVSPLVASDEWPLRAVVGERVRVEATVFREGHGLIGAAVLLRAPGGDKGGGRARRYPMTDQGNDRWAGEVVVDGEGRWTYAIEASGDPYGTWRHAT